MTDSDHQSRNAEDSPAASVHRVMFVLQTTALGGMESHCVDLAGELARRSITVRAVVPSDNGFNTLADRFRSANVQVDRIDTDGRNGRRSQVAQLFRLAIHMRTFAPDVIHLQTGGATGGTAVVALARLAGAAAVVTEHDVPIERPTQLARASRSLLDRWVNVLIAVSRRNAALRAARIRPPADRFAVVLNGVPIPEIGLEERRENRQTVRLEHGIPSDRVVVGSLVRLAEGKGLPELIRAFALVHASAGRCELLLVGDGPLRGELTELTKSLGVADMVHFAGNQGHPGMYLDAFDVFVLAVPEGSMSIALLEAMARGLPSLITFCGPEEAIRPDETGVCGPPNDPAGLAAALAPMIEDANLRERLGRAAAAHVRRHYSVSRVADDILDLYASARGGVTPPGLRADASVDPRPGNRQRVRGTAGGGVRDV